MQQIVYGIINDSPQELALPAPNELVIDGVKWGKFDELFTPAYWAVQAWLDTATKRYSSFSLGKTLREEVAACLLGGYGIPSEVGLSAYQLVKNKGLLDGKAPGEEKIISALKEPINRKGKVVHYRFAKQRGRYLSKCLQVLSSENPPCSNHQKFRDWLVKKMPGIGPKTASWITRNWLHSDMVAIIDIHLYRAGLIAGFFNKTHSVNKDYPRMEDNFLRFAAGLDVKASVLDTLIWRQMKEYGVVGRRTAPTYSD